MPIKIAMAMSIDLVMDSDIKRLSHKLFWDELKQRLL